MKPNEIVICCIADQPSKISSNFMVSGGLNINMGKKHWYGAWGMILQFKFDISSEERIKFKLKTP